MSGGQVVGAALRVLTDASLRLLTVSQNGNAVPAGTPVLTPSGGVVVGWGVAGARRLLRCYGNAGTPGVFVQVHDLAAAPGAGAVPLFSFVTAAGLAQNWSLDFAAIGGMPFTNGVQVYASTAFGTYAAAPGIVLLGQIASIP